MVTCPSLQACDNSTKVRKNEHTCCFMLCHEHCAHARQVILFVKPLPTLAKVEFPSCLRHSSAQTAPTRPNSVAIANLYVWGKDNLSMDSFAAFDAWVSSQFPAALDIIPPSIPSELPSSSSCSSNVAPFSSSSTSPPPTSPRLAESRQKALKKLSEKSKPHKSSRKKKRAEDSDSDSSDSDTSSSDSDQSSSDSPSSSDDDRHTRRRKHKKGKKKKVKWTAKYVRKIYVYMKELEIKTPTSRQIAKKCKIWLALDAGLQAYGDKCHFRSARRLVRDELRVLLQKRAGVMPDYHEHERDLFTKLLPDLPSDAFSYGLKKAEKRAAAPSGNFRTFPRTPSYAHRAPPAHTPAYQPAAAPRLPQQQFQSTPRCQYCSTPEAPVFHYYSNCPICIARRAGKK